ncbi:MAG TPA: squalene/phytoene synthase family protein [Solirubrobacteraceae bacterium]|nr:squalene/phytoene synthase family protein [Solirubrobacteraceae bacterium]
MANRLPTANRDEPTTSAPTLAHSRARAALAADRSTFAPALRLLPAHLRADVDSLYRVLRTLDDLVDEDDPRAPSRVDAVERWARAEPADTPETRTLTDLRGRYPLSPEAMAMFCAGMRHDIARAPIDSTDDFDRYCQQAGGSVGIMLAQILGTTRPEGETLMATLGRAMQWTNILRDIDEDLAHQRVYLPRTTLERFGQPLPGAREALLRDQIAGADALYEEGLQAIALLREGRRAMSLSATLYREILRQIERDGYGRSPGRTEVTAWRRRLLIAENRLRRRSDEPPRKRP